MNIYDDHFTFKCVDKNDDDMIVQIVDMEEWLQDELTPRLAAGNALCMAAMKGKIVAGFNLVAFKEVYVPANQQDDNAAKRRCLVRADHGFACLQKKRAWNIHDTSRF